jgi:spore coat protein H
MTSADPHRLLNNSASEEPPGDSERSNAPARIASKSESEHPWDMLRFTRFRLSPFMVAALIFCSLIAPGRGADSDVVINEIMYHPALQLDELQYVELFNRADTAADLSRWSFKKGITFEFPPNTQLAPGAYLVICRNARAFASNYGTNIPVLGDFTGRLSHHGEKLELCNAAGAIVDAVKYSDHAPWPVAPDGHSSALERICPFSSGEEPGNWAPSVLPAFEKPAGSPGRRNDNYSSKPVPFIDNATCKLAAPQSAATITADVKDTGQIKAVTLLWRIASSGRQGPETAVPMERIAGDESAGTYRGAIVGVPAGTLVRWRVKAENQAGAETCNPSPNELHPAYSYSTIANTNPARIAFAYVLNVARSQMQSRVEVWNGRRYRVPASPTRGNGAFVYVPPGGGAVQTFDYVSTRPRKGGFKVKFGKDHFKEMTGINVIFEGPPRWVLAEPMAYELYRLAGNPACQAEHVRVWMDGRPMGYQLLIEQPNKGFLTRNHRDNSGYLYKVTYMAQGLREQHIKKTRRATGYDDLVGLYNGLTRTAGADQWNFIQKNFNVEEFINYYAVNMCIQNWDGFFNNYYLYHDTATGKWETYPWDEDKTWGEYDGCSPQYDWYEMPLTFGMGEHGAFGFGGFGMGGGWMRPPGWFSGPLLANREFRRAFLGRLKEICNTIFTEEKIVPLIDAMEERLTPEIPIRAQLTGQSRQAALQQFHDEIQSLRNQVKYRRQFILREIPKDRAGRF